MENNKEVVTKEYLTKIRKIQKETFEELCDKDPQAKRKAVENGSLYNRDKTLSYSIIAILEHADLSIGESIKLLYSIKEDLLKSCKINLGE